MMINLDKVSGIQPLNNVNNTRRTTGTESVKSGTDTISISDEAKEAAKAYYLNQVADETPDVRADLVASIKEKIKDPNYLNPDVIRSAAEQIMTNFGL